jgi:hypothetical protein
MPLTQWTFAWTLANMGDSIDASSYPTITDSMQSAARWRKSLECQRFWPNIKTQTIALVGRTAHANAAVARAKRYSLLNPEKSGYQSAQTLNGTYLDKLSGRKGQKHRLAVVRKVSMELDKVRASARTLKNDNRERKS